LNCWWCHNPEGRSSKPEIVVVETRCIRCGECVKVCPEDGISLVSGESASANIPDSVGTKAAIPQNGIAATQAFFTRTTATECRLCGACVEACPTGARQMSGRSMTVEEVLAEISKDTVFYDDSGGGVTFSGGEPLMQREFLRVLLEACCARGIHTAVDTCGYAPFESFEVLAPVTNLFLYDLKFVDDSRHIQYTGVSNDLILENLRSLGKIHSRIWIRIPIIPSVNDSPGQMEAMAHLAASIPGVEQVNLLPYHATAIHKFKRLGKEYPLADVQPPSVDFMESMVRKFAARGLNAKVGG
jgi:pyruvate formate lyase activating enzyme